MKKWLIPVIVIAVIVMGFYKWGVGFNNNAVRLNENVGEAWGNVQTSYQRRNDLIGNLVKTVQGAADFERSTLTDVIEARAKATSTTIEKIKQAAKPAITKQQIAQAKDYIAAGGKIEAIESKYKLTNEQKADITKA